MNILKADDESLMFAKVIDYEPNIMINYTLVETTSRKLRSIDRGSRSDRYECTFTFRGKSDYIKELYETFYDLRVANKSITLTDCEENFFGENIDHSIPITAVVIDMGETESPSFRVKEFSVKMLADTNSLEFVGTGGLSPELSLLKGGWAGYSTWNTSVITSYYGNINFVDAETDRFLFKGNYFISKPEMKYLLNFWRTNRGNEFVANESVFGTGGNMFGYQSSATSHTMVVKSMKYERASAQHVELSLELIKV